MRQNRFSRPLALMLALGSAALWAQDQPPGEEAELPVVKMSPQIRIVERDREYFAELPCLKLDQVEVRSEQEAHWLKRRRQECLRQVRELAE